MAISAVLNPGTEYPVMRRDGTHTGITYVMHGDALYCRLPSGRYLTYHRPRLEPNTRGFGGAYSFSYEGYNTNPQQGATGWVTMYAYGGKFCENVVQATARDIQRYAIINLEKAGYHVVLHVYDEDVAEIPQGWGSVEELERIMSTMPAWATYKGKPWPIKANGGWRGRRYRKA
jgi:DNA polymerase